jgi:hypothetical protein
VVSAFVFAAVCAVQAGYIGSQTKDERRVGSERKNICPCTSLVGNIFFARNLPPLAQCCEQWNVSSG